MELITVLAAEPALVVGAMTVLGLMVGSFLNVVIHRLPLMMEQDWDSECRVLLDLPAPAPAPAPLSLARPRSRCPHCQAPIAAHENIPLLSFAVLGGRCRHCRATISARYPLIEALGGILGASAAWHVGYAADALTPLWLLRALFTAVFGWSLLALAAIDFDTKLLPDSITQPLMWLGIASALTGLSAVSLPAAVVGAIAGYLSLWAVYWAFKLLTGKDGMGYGDFKLLAALGAWLGWQVLPAVILLSSALGALVGIGLLATGLVKRSEPMPFGPFLALAGIIALYFREELLRLFSGGGGV